MPFFRLQSLFSSLLLLSCFGVSPVLARIDTLRTFPDNRFINGAPGFGQYLMSSIRYPSQAQQDAVVGTSLVSLLVTPSGKLANVAILNSLGKAIDGEVIRVIQAANKGWLPTDQEDSQDSIMMILPVTFLLGEKNFYVDEVKPDFILSESEVVVVGYGQSASAKDDEYHTTKLNSAIQEKNYKQAIKHVNELIRRNPFNEKLYYCRAKAEHELGQTEEACNDYKKILVLFQLSG